MKLTKKLAAIAMALTMTFSTTAMSVSAAKWVKSDNGIMYQYDNGSYAKSKWLKTKSGDRYYIKADGTRATGWTEIDGDMYYFNKKTGKATINKKIVIGSYSYKFDKNGVWNGKVYSKDGKKNVTKSVNVAKLTGQSSSTSSNKTTTNKTTDKSTAKKASGEVPATVTINGKTYVTSATNKYVGTKADAIYPKGINGTKYERDNMWDFDISGCSDKDLEVLKYFKNITTLNLIDWDNTSTITNLDFCQYMPNLKYVYVTGAINLTDVSGLGACKNLYKIEISNCKLTNLDGLESLKNVKKVNIAYTWLDNLDGLVNCAKLEEVIVNQGRLTDISALTNKSKLTYVSFNTNRRLKDITALTKCANLEELHMNSCTSVNTWEALKKMSSLNRVTLCFNVLGSKGPYTVGDWLINNTKVNVAYGNPNKLWSGTHPDTKEWAINAAWDAAYRPATVYGDDAKCGAGCDWCTVSKDNIAQKHGLA